MVTVKLQGLVARSLVSANRWLRGIKMYIHTYIHTLLARPQGAFQSQFYITKL